MSEYVEVTEPITTDAGTFRVCVEYDQDGVNPREDFDQLGTMVCQPSREYQVPREGDLVSMIGEAWERGGARLAVRYLSTVHNAVVLPVYGYERPTAGELGETIDNRSSIVGVIYALRSDIEAEWVGSGNPMPTDAEIAGWLAGEVTTYAAWATIGTRSVLPARHCAPRRDTAHTGVVTLTSTEISDMRVFTEKATLSGIDDDETHSHLWVTDFNTAGVGVNV